MKLYLLKRKAGTVRHDENQSMVIAANTTFEARRLARDYSNSLGDEDSALWQSTEQVQVRQIGDARAGTRPGVVHVQTLDAG